MEKTEDRINEPNYKRHEWGKILGSKIRIELQKTRIILYNKELQRTYLRIINENTHDKGLKVVLSSSIYDVANVFSWSNLSFEFGKDGGSMGGY